jgi:hypothetical protein
MATFWDPGHERILELLGTATIEACQQLPHGSNYSFAIALASPEFEEPGLAIYKPRRGEAPLWDFPDGTLFKRERAAYLLARFLGWPAIPPTIIRDDGPYGPGAVQVWIDNVRGEHFFTMRDRGGFDFRDMVAFDWITNNADRRGGHCLLAKDGRVWSIDHGLTFNALPRMRSVIWEYVGEPLPDPVCSGLESLLMALEAPFGEVAEIATLLAVEEMEELRIRTARLLRGGHFPDFPEGANYRPVPWPPV